MATVLLNSAGKQAVTRQLGRAFGGVGEEVVLKKKNENHKISVAANSIETQRAGKL